jgi:hypothetical protein
MRRRANWSGRSRRRRCRPRTPDRRAGCRSWQRMLDRCAIRIRKHEARPGAQLCQAKIDLVHLELLGVIADQRGLERVAVLRAEIMAVIQRKRSEPVPVRTGGERTIEGAPGGLDRLRTGTERRVGLIAKSGPREAGELIRRQFAVENSDVPLRLLRHLRSDVAHLQRRFEIGAPAGRSRGERTARPIRSARARAPDCRRAGGRRRRWRSRDRDRLSRRPRI